MPSSTSSAWRSGTPVDIPSLSLMPALLSYAQHATNDSDHSAQSSSAVETQASTPATSATSHTGSDTTLTDLKNYVALGCLYFEFATDNHVYSFAPDSDWVELLHLSSGLSEALGPETLKLLQAGWIRLFSHRSPRPHITWNGTLIRAWLLPGDIGRRFIDRQSKSLKLALRNLLPRLDVSSEAWAGNYSHDASQTFDPWATAENLSLFYLFNKLPSPAPSPSVVKSRYARKAMEDVLQCSSAPWSDGEGAIAGLKTQLYPYQARSAALMIQRESSPHLQLDPRLEIRQSPNGEKFYYGARDGSFLQEPRYYETNRGGILAETMGLGKTLICLAVILATRFHAPQIPPEHQKPQEIRERVGSLVSMVASTIGRYAIPARAYLKACEEKEGLDLRLCARALDENIASYEVPAEPPRMNRTTRIPPPETFVMCSATIIVVPRNLLHQWQSEIRKHVRQGSLKILIVDSKARRRDPKDKGADSEGSVDMELRNDLPVAGELVKYDIILFSRNRFEQEIQDGADDKGRRLINGAPLTCQCPYIGASRVRDCTCLSEDGLYQSPLKKLHFLRIIIDEGHNFSSGSSNAVLVAKQIRAERRWVVSGTPAKDLVGVEVDLSTLEGADGMDPSTIRDLAVEQRKTFSAKDDTTGAAKSLGSLAANFLGVRPWSDSRAEGKLEWDDYIYRHEHHHRRTYSGFSSCFLRTLEGMVIKTRPEDVEKDITLPPMKHQVIHIKPCWFDKMTANLFIQVLRANAITSERTDNDYLFHKNNAKPRHHLLANLRQSNFTWTGFRLDDLVGTIETSKKYLDKEEKSCSKEDHDMLLQSLGLVESLLESDHWKALSKAHEVGMFVEAWPEDSVDAFSLTSGTPAMIGITQLLEGQIHVDDQITSTEPADGLSSVGELAKAKIEAIEEAEKKASKKKDADSSDTKLIKTGLPSSCVDGEPAAGRKLSIALPRKSPTKAKTSTISETGTPVSETPGVQPASPVRPKKRKLTLAERLMELPEDSPLRNTKLIGTTSAKLSYILKRVMAFQAEEKILIFYDGDNAAYYIAQCLELLHVDHRIYARTLDNASRSKYVALFNEDPNIRILLIDVACGALGLNLNVASVVLIINPINRPSIEAQAIKRAHRIGQTKRVLVETLVLEGTIEEAIFNRAANMSRNEHLEAKTLEDDDEIQSIIQNAKVVPIQAGETEGRERFAPLDIPQQIFGRPGRAKFMRIGQDEGSPEKPKKRVRKSTPAKSKSKRKKDDPDVMVVDGPAAAAVSLDGVDSAAPIASSIFGDPSSRRPT